MVGAYVLGLALGPSTAVPPGFASTTQFAQTSIIWQIGELSILPRPFSGLASVLSRPRPLLVRVDVTPIGKASLKSAAYRMPDC